MTDPHTDSGQISGVGLLPCPWCDGPTERFRAGDIELVRHSGKPHCLAPSYAVTLEQWNTRKGDGCA